MGVGVDVTIRVMVEEVADMIMSPVRGLTVEITMDKIEVAAGAPRGLLGVTAIKV